MKKSELRQIIKEEISELISSTAPTAPAANVPNVPNVPNDVKRLNKALNISTVKAATVAINDRNELKKAMSSITKSWGPMLQPNKISLSAMLSDIKTGLAAAGYK